MADEDDDLTQDLFTEEQPVLDNAGSPAAVRKRITRTKLQAKEGAAFWRTALSTRAGRRELYLLLQNARTFDTPFACGPTGFPQPEASWWQAGQHDLGQRLFLSWQRIDRDAVFLMLDENDPRFSRREPVTKDLAES